jgi:hypothetical protein
VACFFRVVELDDGRGWLCRFGRREYDVHAELEHAIEHVKALAADHLPAEVVVHGLDGSVENLGAV